VKWIVRCPVIVMIVMQEQLLHTLSFDLLVKLLYFHILLSSLFI